MTGHLDALVLDVDARAGLCIARRLGRTGLRVGVATRERDAPGLATRFAVRRAVFPDPYADREHYVDAMLEELAEAPADAILPSIDASVEALDRRRDEIGRLAAPAIASGAALAVATSKEATLSLAAELGIAAPRSLRADTPAEAEEAAAELGLPCVLKPVSSWRTVGAGGERVGPVYASTSAVLAARAAELVRPDAPALVQEVAPGRRETYKLFRADGRVHARLAMVVDRTWPPLGGSSVMRHTIAAPADALAAAERLVAEIGVDGYSEVEFRRAADGRALLMEVNPRLSQSIEVAIRAGVDFARMQLEWARGGRLPEAPREPRAVRVGWLGGELRLLVAAAAGTKEEPRPQLAPVARGIAADYLVRGARIDGLDLADLRPMLGSLALPFRSLARRAG